MPLYRAVEMLRPLMTGVFHPSILVHIVDFPFIAGTGVVIVMRRLELALRSSIDLSQNLNGSRTSPAASAGRD